MPINQAGSADALGREGVPAAPGRHEHLLRDVLGVVRVTERTEGEGVDQCGPPVVHVREGQLVALHQPFGQ